MRSISLYIAFVMLLLSFSFSKNTIKIESSAFKNGEYIPEKYTCDGKDISPHIKWKEFPKHTKSFVLIMEDPDAPYGTFTHWIVYNIPVEKNYLEENFPKKEKVGAVLQGVNDFGFVGYGGPCPPPGKSHRYFFKVYALDVEDLSLPPGATRKQIEEKIKNHILATGYMYGLYRR